MDPHLIHIPSLTTLTTRCLTGANLQMLGRQTHWALDTEILGFGALDEFGADFFERGDVARGESDADFVDLGTFAEVFFAFLVGHVWMVWDGGRWWISVVAALWLVPVFGSVVAPRERFTVVECDANQDSDF